MAGKRGRSGPKKGNKNAYKNGTRIVVKRLVVGELPTSMIAVKREAREYRRGLEVDILRARRLATEEEMIEAASSWQHWELFVNERITERADKEAIAAAVQHTIAIGINRWELRNNFSKMSSSDRRAASKEMRDAAKDRAKIVREMNLHVTVDPWIVLDAASNGKTEATG